MLKPESFTKVGVEPPKGVLLVGPPGTGKTLMAKAVANATNASFIRLIGSELVQKYIGEGARLVRELFQLAQERAPSIIFIDELDAVGAKRMDVGTTGDREVQRTLMQLLGELDGFTPRGQVSIMGASNRPDILDEALLRPGRFDRIIKIPLPEEEARNKIIKIHSKSMNIAKGVSYKKLAAETEGFSGADLRALCVEAGMKAIKDNKTQTTYKHFTEALDKIRNRLDDSEISEPESGLYY
jgi:proteasome regulatory subunit